MFLLFLLSLAFGTSRGMDNNNNKMSIYTFGEAFSLGTLLEEQQDFTYVTYLQSLEDAQKGLQTDPQSKLLLQFMDIVHHKDIPEGFDQFKAHGLGEHLPFGDQKNKLICSTIFFTIIKEAEKTPDRRADFYFNQLRQNIYANRSILIDALKHNDKEVLKQFKENRQQHPWHLLHILSDQEWKSFKKDFERTQL